MFLGLKILELYLLAIGNNPVEVDIIGTAAGRVVEV